MRNRRRIGGDHDIIDGRFIVVVSDDDIVFNDDNDNDDWADEPMDR